jgi:hypothetical protein
MARNKKKDSGQKIIANMGLYWKRENVRWVGSRSEKRKLIGKRAKEKTGGSVDFWKQTGIYALYNTDYDLIYVGQAGFGDKSCIGDRLKHHTRDDLSGRWDKFSWFGLRKVTNKNKLGNKPQHKGGNLTSIGNVLEAILIEVAEPPMNSQGGKFGNKVERYLQDEDERADKYDKSHKKILKNLARLSTDLKKLSRKINKQRS